MVTPTTEKQSCIPKVELRASQKGSESRDVWKEEKNETTSSVEKELSTEILKSDSDGRPIAISLGQDTSKFPASPVSVDHLSVSDEHKRNLCLGHQSPCTISLSVDTQQAPPVVDMGGRLLTHSEEEEEDDDDDDDDPMRGDEHFVAVKQELHEQKVNPELLLDEMSNLSHGDESSSGFMGSPGEPDTQLSMEFSLESAARSHTDNLLTETDDSLPFEPLRSDRDKVKRRGSPGRSRVKQVRSPFV